MSSQVVGAFQKIFRAGASGARAGGAAASRARVSSHLARSSRAKYTRPSASRAAVARRGYGSSFSGYSRSGRLTRSFRDLYSNNPLRYSDDLKRLLELQRVYQQSALLPGRTAAASRIQAAFRASRPTFYNAPLGRAQAATTIQRAYRGVQGRRLANVYSNLLGPPGRRLALNSGARTSNVGRNSWRNAHDSIRMSDRARHGAAVRIQRAFRSSRPVFHSARSANPSWAATTIQRVYRGSRVPRYSASAARNASRGRAATRIQSLVRRAQASQRTSNVRWLNRHTGLPYTYLTPRMNLAANIFQRGYRRTIGRLLPKYNQHRRVFSNISKFHSKYWKPILAGEVATAAAGPVTAAAVLNEQKKDEARDIARINDQFSDPVQPLPPYVEPYTYDGDDYYDPGAFGHYQSERPGGYIDYNAPRRFLTNYHWTDRKRKRRYNR